ncbi:hypothetical protein F4781DRAFT_191226 [Annulohypoxylon bovei var. microspora]|nr:hypothetical protein F4781DRAFT_191226 [Annulohypoxylon bovei var. microspora]
MQFTMGRPTGAHQPSGSARQSATKPDPYKQNLIKQHRHKSQPFDPDDLRRRLYVVIAEQEALKEKRKRRERLAEAPSAQSKDHDTPISQPEPTNLGPNESSFAARVTRHKSTASDQLSKESSTQPPPEPKAVRSMSKSIQDKLRRKSIIKVEPPPATATTTTDSAAQTQTQPQAPPYPYVPQEAAAQFERTATANSMRSRNLVHSLSQTALKHQASRRASDLDDASAPPPQQQTRALERAHSQRDKPIEFRNPFQSAQPASASDEREEGTRFRRHSVIGLTHVVRGRRKSAIADIAEDEPPAGVAVRLAAPAELPVDEASSEETLAVAADPAAAAHEHRVDWTQSDEAAAAAAAAYEKPRAASRIPLLKKADSLWTLKGRLGGRSPGKSASGGAHDKMGAMKQEEAFASSPSPKFLRFGFLTKFKR